MKRGVEAAAVVLAQGGTSRWMPLRLSFDHLEPSEALPFARAAGEGGAIFRRRRPGARQDLAMEVFTAAV